MSDPILYGVYVETNYIYSPLFYGQYIESGYTPYYSPPGTISNDTYVQLQSGPSSSGVSWGDLDNVALSGAPSGIIAYAATAGVGVAGSGLFGDIGTCDFVGVAT